MDLTMEPEARAAFLADAHIGVFAVDRRDGPPLQTPLWYTYEPGGDVLVVTGAGSEKARLVTERGESSLCVQHDAAPYRFVTVSGPTVLEPVTIEVRRAIARRYMPDDAVDGYLAMTADQPMVTLRLHPTRWRSNDFAKLAVV